jgi:hypothetical protein
VKKKYTDNKLHPAQYKLKKEERKKMLRQRRKGMKGQTDTRFIIFCAAFVGILIWMGAQIVETNPEYQVLPAFDAVVMGGTFLGIAGTCVIATGLPCAGAIVITGLGGFFLVQNTVVFSLIFLPLALGLVYVVARLARGGG